MQPENTIAERLNGFSEWLQQEMQHWKVPGAAIGVIYKGEVIFAEGFGYRDVEKQLPVTTDTLFAIGSCSKAFTSYGLGLLVDAGKLSWDKPVREYLPDFRLYDSVATDYATPRDIVSHRTGLPRHDYLWYGSPLSRKELYQRVRYIQPNKTFRAGYDYQNLMFLTAGYLLGEIEGTTWEDFTQRNILDKLGMSRSNFSVETSKSDEDAALPYSPDGDGIKLIPFRNIDAAGPAGSINSSVNEMLRWIQLNLDGGKFNGEQLISKETLSEIHHPQTVIKNTPESPWYGGSDVTHTAYALGWATQTYRGSRMVRHGGGIDGFISSVAFFPDNDFGIVVLTNTGNSFPASVFTFNLLDRLLELEPIDWRERFEANRDLLKAMGEKAKQAVIEARKENTQPSHLISDYAGTYEHPGYGTLEVTYKDDALHLDFHTHALRLAHHHYDTFQMTDGEDLFTLVRFESDLAGGVAAVHIPWEPTVDPIEFRKQASAE